LRSQYVEASLVQFEFVSIREHTSEYVSIRQHLEALIASFFEEALYGSLVGAV
jgi:hypothetical protein